MKLWVACLSGQERDCGTQCLTQGPAASVRFEDVSVVLDMRGCYRKGQAWS